MSAEDDLDMLLSVLTPEEAVVTMLKVMFLKQAEAAASLDLLQSAIYAIAAKVGVSPGAIHNLNERLNSDPGTAS